MTEHTIREPRPLDLLDVQVWKTAYWADVARRIGSIFARSETRTNALDYLAGLLSPAERKTSWQMAELVGAATPYGFQHLLGRATWDPDALRDRLYAYVTDYLADPDAIGVLDETGFLKKGTHSAGVARQYSGTAGRVENCQVGVFLTYASAAGQTILDRALYLPAAWTDDPARGQAAGIPAERGFATKPALARQLLERAAAAHVTLAWVAGDSVYGDDRPLRQWLEARHQPYVLAISRIEQLWVDTQAWTVDDLLARCPETGWERMHCGHGSQGPRWYDVQRIALHDPLQPGWKRWVVFRRSCTAPDEVTAYRAFAPASTTLAILAHAIGRRWTVEESFQTGKGEVGLDHYEVRSWTGWYRHITLAMWAQAFLAVLRAESPSTAPREDAPVAPAWPAVGTGSQATASPQKGGRSAGRPSSLARFKARRGLRSG